MTTPDYIVHRANSPQNTKTPVDQVAYYIGLGFSKVEIDIYAITQTTYKFCHPIDKDKVAEVHDIHDGFLRELVTKFPRALWFVDLKCLDLEETPTDMIDYIIEAFGSSGIFISAQREILDYIHHQGIQTGQYFRAHEDVKLDFEPDFYLKSTVEGLCYPKQKTVFCSKDLATAKEHLADGFAGIMVDGDLLIQ